MCKNGVILRGENVQDILWLKSNCGTYKCPECARLNVAKHYARALNGIHKLRVKEWYFETYTAHKLQRGFNKSVKNLRAGFKLIQQRKRDRKGGAGYFIKVFESHADGALHLHVLTSITLADKFRYIKKRDSFVGRLNDEGATAGMGYKAESVKLKSPVSAVTYTIGYILKSAQDDGLPKHFRRVEYSKDFPKLDKRGATDMEWQAFVKESLAYIDDYVRRDGLSGKRVLGRDGRDLDVDGLYELGLAT